VFWAACLGGALVELAHWWRLRPRKFPVYARSPRYWIITVLMVLSGGGLALLYYAPPAVFQSILALHIGASAPLLIHKIGGQLPATDYHLGDGEVTGGIRAFLRG